VSAGSPRGLEHGDVVLLVKQTCAEKAGDAGADDRDSHDQPRIRGVSCARDRSSCRLPT
jgi:hypothetical protein